MCIISLLLTAKIFRRKTENTTVYIERPDAGTHILFLVTRTEATKLMTVTLEA